jgi:hypothetical protein
MFIPVSKNHPPNPSGLPKFSKMLFMGKISKSTVKSKAALSKLQL